MKVKTSITLSEELIKQIDKFWGEYKNRSELVEKALRDYIKREYRKKRDMVDLEILNREAKKLNKEAEDVLSFQSEK